MIIQKAINYLERLLAPKPKPHPSLLKPDEIRIQTSPADEKCMVRPVIWGCNVPEDREPDVDTSAPANRK